MSSGSTTIVLLVYAMGLVFACTLAESHWGVYGAVQYFFRRPFLMIFVPGVPFPVPFLPGGGLLGAALILNLIASRFYHMEFSWTKAGLWLTHTGFLLLIVGEFVTGLTQLDRRMVLAEGQPRSHLIDPRQVELALVDSADPLHDSVAIVPEKRLRSGKNFTIPLWGLSGQVLAYYPNATTRALMPGETAGVASQGVGTGLWAREVAPVVSDEEIDQPGALLHLSLQGQTLGTWWVSTALENPQEVSIGNSRLELSLRYAREYLPFDLTLKKFRHETYEGTDIPSHFSSQVTLRDAARGEPRDILITMNHPFRYGGRSFFQSGYGEGGRVSILQVVKNPGRTIPYIVVGMISLGLLFHFGRGLQRFLRGKARTS